MAFLLQLLLSLLLFIHSMDTTHISPNVRQTNVSELMDLHSPNYQVYPLLRLKLTSSVLPAAIQMLTAYIEKLEQIQRTQQEIENQNHHNHFTSTTSKPTEKPEVTSAPEVVDAYSAVNGSLPQGTSGSNSSSTERPASTLSSAAQIANTIIHNLPTRRPETVTNGSPVTASTTTGSIQETDEIGSSTGTSVLPNISTGTEAPHGSHPGYLGPADPTTTPQVVTTQETNEHTVDIVQTTVSSKVETNVTQATEAPEQGYLGGNFASTESIPPTNLNETTGEMEQPQTNVSTSIHANVEEVSIPNELYEMTTTEYEQTEIPTESLENVETSTEPGQATTNVYEININEETLIDIELILGDKKRESDETKAHTEEAKSGRRLKYEDSQYKQKTKTSHAASSSSNQHKGYIVANNAKGVRNTTATYNRVTQNLEALKNKTLPITNSAYYNKTSNIVKNTLQNILAQQRNRTTINAASMKQKLNQTMSGPVKTNITNTATSLTNKKNNNDTEMNSLGTKIFESHLKESNFNKTSDELFVSTLNEIVTEEKTLQNPNKEVAEDLKQSIGDDLMSRFWGLANFFTAMHHFLSGDLHLVHQAANKITEKRQENYMKNVTRQLMFLKIFYNIEAKSGRLWRYHGYSKSATKFLKMTSEVPPSEQLKLTLSRLIERGNIKHERTIEATKKFLVELETSDSNVNKALKQCPTMKFT